VGSKKGEEGEEKGEEGEEKGEEGEEKGEGEENQLNVQLDQDCDNILLERP
jgi:hypothetical protein